MIEVGLVAFDGTKIVQPKVSTLFNALGVSDGAAVGVGDGNGLRVGLGLGTSFLATTETGSDWENS